MISTEKALGSYLIGSAIIWAGIFIATAVILKGTDHFAQLLPILGGGMVWFIILVPLLFQRRCADASPTRRGNALSYLSRQTRWQSALGILTAVERWEASRPIG
jgi:hypothetical protein